MFDSKVVDCFNIHLSYFNIGHLVINSMVTRLYSSIVEHGHDQ